MIQDQSLNQPRQRQPIQKKATAGLLRRIRQTPRLRIKEGWQRIKSLPLWVKQSVFIILGAEAQTFSALFVSWLFPSFANQKVDIFLRPDYHNQMHVSWLFYYCSQEVERVFWAYVFCKISLRLSNYLFLFFILIFGYTLFGLIMFWWDFKRSELMWIDAFWTLLLLTWGLLKGYKEEYLGKVKSLF